MIVKSDFNEFQGLELLEENEDSIDKVIELTNSNNWRGLVYVCEEPDKIWKQFKQQYQFIQAAGGVVYNDHNELLMILRKGKWDLPKGKVDKGEGVEDAARREVIEECGLVTLELREKLGSTWHTYKQEGKHILKESVWYKGYAPGNQELHPQFEEDIARCEWRDKEGVKEAMLNTYAAIGEILQEKVLVKTR